MCVCVPARARTQTHTDLKSKCSASGGLVVVVVGEWVVSDVGDHMGCRCRQNDKMKGREGGGEGGDSCTHYTLQDSLTSRPSYQAIRQ